MFVRQFKKLLSLKNKNRTIGRVGKGLDFLIAKLKDAASESQVIVDKLKHLHKTNYELGLDHLKRGNLREATFRFKIVRKFWPEDHNAHLKLIYCYIIENKDEYVDDAIKYLLSIDSSYGSQIERLREDAKFYNPSEKKKGQ